MFASFVLAALEVRFSPPRSKPMRRSVREAILGFSVLLAVIGGLAFWFWLRGISLSRNTWRLKINFEDASGLAARSPVIFRGVLVGSVRSIKVTNKAVLAEVEITDPNLRLYRPVVAKVTAASLLGGDAQVALISYGKPLPPNSPGPRESGCDLKRELCDGGAINGMESASIDSIAAMIQELLDQVDRQQVIPEIVAATKSFQSTAKETEQLSVEAQAFLKDAQQLSNKLSRAVEQTDPILNDLTLTSANAAKASQNINSLTQTLTQPEVAQDLRETIANARQLTARWDAVGGNLNKLTGDPKFIGGIRSLAVGLGAFFEELYPAQTEAARERAERDQPDLGPVMESAEQPEVTLPVTDLAEPLGFSN